MRRSWRSKTAFALWSRTVCAPVRASITQIVLCYRADASAAERPAQQPRQRKRAVPQRGTLVGVAPVEELGDGGERLPERLVVRMPVEVPHARGLAGDVLDVHALVGAELRVDATEPGLLGAAAWGLV